MEKSEEMTTPKPSQAEASEMEIPNRVWLRADHTWSTIMNRTAPPGKFEYVRATPPPESADAEAVEEYLLPRFVRGCTEWTIIKNAYLAGATRVRALVGEELSTTIGHSNCYCQKCKDIAAKHWKIHINPEGDRPTKEARIQELEKESAERLALLAQQNRAFDNSRKERCAERDAALTKLADQEKLLDLAEKALESINEPVQGISIDEKSWKEWWRFKIYEIRIIAREAFKELKVRTR